MGPDYKAPENLPHYDSEDERREATRNGAIGEHDKNEWRRLTPALAAESGQTIAALALARATTERFAEMLSGNLDRPVKDMTQLEGEYSFQLEWTPDIDLRDDGPSSRVSIFTAIQEQLGLKLEAGNEAIELLVIDKAEKAPQATERETGSTRSCLTRISILAFDRTPAVRGGTPVGRVASVARSPARRIDAGNAGHWIGDATKLGAGAAATPNTGAAYWSTLSRTRLTPCLRFWSAGRI